MGLGKDSHSESCRGEEVELLQWISGLAAACRMWGLEGIGRLPLKSATPNLDSTRPQIFNQNMDSL